MTELPHGITRTETNGATTWDIDLPTCTGRIHQTGATITSFAPRSQDDALFQSPHAARTPGRAIRGGIPLCAPWFGPGRGGYPVPNPHGFLRTLPWRLTHATRTGDEARLVLTPDPDDTATQRRPDNVPDDLTFELAVTFGATLDVELAITSPTRDTLIDAALHTYLAVRDAATSSITGLEGAPLIDKVTGQTRTQHGRLTFTGETDLVFDTTATVHLDDGRRRITIARRNSANIIVWNPWADKAATMADLQDAWPRFICVEAGNVLRAPMAIPAGGRAAFATTISVEDRPG